MRAESAFSLYITWPLRLGIGLRYYIRSSTEFESSEQFLNLNTFSFHYIYQNHMNWKEEYVLLLTNLYVYVFLHNSNIPKYLFTWGKKLGMYNCTWPNSEREFFSESNRGHSSITSSKRWVGGVRKWQFLMIYSTVSHQRGGWVGLKKSKTWWRNTWMPP